MDKRPAERVAFFIVIPLLASLAAAAAPVRHPGSRPPGAALTADSAAVPGLPGGRAWPPGTGPALAAPTIVKVDALATGAAAGAYWAKAYGTPDEDSAGLIRRTADSGFVFAGFTGSFSALVSDLWLMKIDASGNRVWEKTYGTPGLDFGSISAAPGGGYLLSAESSDDQGHVTAFTLAKLDDNGAIVWQKRLLKDGSAASALDLAFPLSDAGFLVTGSTSTFIPTPPYFAYIDEVIRVSSAGNIVWQKNYPRPASDMLVPFGVQELADHSLLQVGQKYPAPTDFQHTDAWVRKFSSAGAVLVDKYFGGTEAETLGQITPLTGGGYIAIGTTKSWLPPGDTVGNIWVVKFDANFNILIEKSFGDTGQESGSIFPLADGTFLMTGMVRAASAPAPEGASATAIDQAGDAFAVKLDSNLNEVWGKTYNAGGSEYGYATVDSTGGFLFSGSTDAVGHGAKDILLFKTDANGNVAWSRVYGGGNDDSGGGSRIGSVAATTTGFGALALADTDIGMLGITKSFGAGSSDLLVAVLDSNGRITGCPFVQDVTLTVSPWTIPVITTTATVTINSPTSGDITSFTTDNSILEVSARTSTVTDCCTATPSLSATAAADTTSGAAPLTVNFTGTASNGTPPYTYDWDFGDGSAHSTQQNPSHSYADPGSFSVTLTVTDSTAKTAIDSHLTITVSGGTCTVGCTATVPATGTVGVAVAFASTATPSNCAGSPTYAWTFGDGSSSTAQNPSHSFAAAGTYDWSLTVTAGTGSCSKNGSITISAAQSCTVGCSATVPGTGTVGTAVPFASTATPSNCAGTPTYAWTFGDGSSSTAQNPSHTYAAAGTFNWTLTVTAGTGSCSKNGSITITGAAAATTLWVPSIAHLPGAGGSKWRSNIAAVNRSGATANLSLVFVPYGAGPNVTKTYALANGATVEWADVLVSLFAFADSANTKGTVKISSDHPIFAISRTYNQAASGTFGQYYPALATSQGISGSQAAVLPLLKKNSAFRTNAGFQNLGASSCTGEIKLFNATGAQVGSTRSLTAAADKYIQDDDVFTKATAGTQDVAYARVQATTAGCKLWFFASVVDSVTNDPTTVPQQLSAAGPFWVPSIAHLPGAGGSKWRSNIAVVNRSGSTANLTLVFTPYGAGATVTKTQSLANNNTIEWADVLVSLFGFPDSANTKGTVKITSNATLFLLSRTYNQAASGTFGQYYPALTATGGITTGQSAVLPLLKKNASFRTNAGFQNLGSASCSGTIKLFNAAGVQVGSTRTLTAAPDKYIQDDDVFTKAAAGNQDVAYALVEVTTSAGTAWFFGSVVDAITNDPTTIPQQLP